MRSRPGRRSSPPGRATSPPREEQLPDRGEGAPRQGGGYSRVGRRCSLGGEEGAPGWGGPCAPGWGRELELPGCRMRRLASPMAAPAGYLHLRDRPDPREHPPAANSEREWEVKISGMADTGTATALPCAAAMLSPVLGRSPLFFCYKFIFYFSPPRSGSSAPGVGRALSRGWGEGRIFEVSSRRRSTRRARALGRPCIIRRQSRGRPLPRWMKSSRSSRPARRHSVVQRCRTVVQIAE